MEDNIAVEETSFQDFEKSRKNNLENETDIENKTENTTDNKTVVEKVEGIAVVPIVVMGAVSYIQGSNNSDIVATAREEEKLSVISSTAPPIVPSPVHRNPPVPSSTKTPKRLVTCHSDSSDSESEHFVTLRNKLAHSTPSSANSSSSNSHTSSPPRKSDSSATIASLGETPKASIARSTNADSSNSSDASTSANRGTFNHVSIENNSSPQVLTAGVLHFTIQTMSEIS